MHQIQAEFIDALAAFQSGPMTEALVRLVETYGAVTCSDSTREELSWLCREALNELEAGWDAHTTLDIPQIPVSICLHVTIVRPHRGAPPVGMRVQMFVARTMPQELLARWGTSGFTEEPIFIERAAIRFPVPLAGEAGHDPDHWRTRPNIHRPNDREELVPELRYTHALSVEADRSSEWLQRYLAGEREQVWAELTALGERVRDPAMLPHAVAVARETMRRCRANVESLHRSLVQTGCPLAEPEAAFVAPAANVLDQIARLEAEVGPLPLSLCAWYELVGSVNFNGCVPLELVAFAHAASRSGVTGLSAWFADTRAQ